MGLGWALAKASVDILGSNQRQESYSSFFLLNLGRLAEMTLPKYTKHEQR